MDILRLLKTSPLAALVGALSFLFPTPLPGAETNAAAAVTSPAAVAATNATESVEAERMLRSYLQLQEQLHATLLAIEQSRAESTLAARANADQLAARLELIEKSLQQQQEQQREVMQTSNRTMLIMAGIFVGVGFLTLLFMAMFQLRGMNRLAEIASGLPAGRALGPGQWPALGAGDPRLLAPDAEPPGGRLQSVIERLERRIGEIEADAQSASNGNARTNNSGASAIAPTAALLGRGESLLKLGQTESALACFDDAIARSPQSAEAQIRKGMALEQLKRNEQAIECYDRAIALDRSSTLAYLRKGSLFNQQERYGEALDCYEQALQAESKA